MFADFPMDSVFRTWNFIFRFHCYNFMYSSVDLLHKNFLIFFRNVVYFNLITKLISGVCRLNVLEKIHRDN